MIRSFADDETRQLYEKRTHRQWAPIRKTALRKLDQLDSASTLNDLRVPPGNNLEGLAGDRAGFYSIRINDQFRVCFRWLEDGAYDVEIVDYH